MSSKVKAMPEGGAGVLVSMFLIFIGCMISSFLGNRSGKESIRKEAARQGLAHYEISKHGDSMFVWGSEKDN